MGCSRKTGGDRNVLGPVRLALLTLVLAACSNPGERLLIVVNANSPVSIAIGERYAELRNVPESNIVRLALPTPDPLLATDAHERISPADYRTQVRDPIEGHLRDNALTEQVSIVVTTKGVPLRIEGPARRRGSFDGWLRDATRASVDSELTLLFSGEDGQPGPAANAYFRSDLAFRAFREQHPDAVPRYLVARITGTLGPSDPHNGVPESVERLLAAATAASEPAIWLIDGDREREGGFAAADRVLFGAAASGLQARGIPAVYDRSPNFKASDAPLLGYASWGSNDLNDPGPPYYGKVGGRLYPGRFAPRSIAVDFVSTSARTFTGPPEYGQSLISALLALGAGGAGGHVDEPTLATVHRPHILFERYAQGDLAVEAYWASVPTVGWMHTWIGDPLMRLDDTAARPTTDRDGDGIDDVDDNCTRIPNPKQRDTDSDGYGNACDPDINNDGRVTSSWGSIFPLGERGDVEWITLTARSGHYDENHDLDGDGRVDAVDISIAHFGLFQPPGPSGRRR